MKFLFIGFLLCFFLSILENQKICTVNEDMPMRYRPIVSWIIFTWICNKLWTAPNISTCPTIINRSYLHLKMPTCYLSIVRCANFKTPSALNFTSVATHFWKKLRTLNFFPNFGLSRRILQTFFKVRHECTSTLFLLSRLSLSEVYNPL